MSPSFSSCTVFRNAHYTTNLKCVIRGQTFLIRKVACMGHLLDAVASWMTNKQLDFNCIDANYVLDRYRQQVGVL